MRRSLRANTVPADVVERAIAELRKDAHLEFSREALAEAERAAKREFPELSDRRDIPFITIDPEGSRDLDQAAHLERRGDGYVVHYAISAVGLFIERGSRLDKEVRERGATVYLPDRSIPLHPEVLSHGAASLLEGEDRPAYLWTIELDARGEIVEANVELAQVRSRAQLTYTQVQAAHDGEGSLPSEVPADMTELLAEIGRKRLVLEEERGGVSLSIPEQSVERTEQGYRLAFREMTGVEKWNAQISLLTGMAAAQMMMKANVGIVRTLPPARQADIDSLRHVAKLMDLKWKGNVGYPEFLRSLSPNNPAHLGFINEATTLFRGAGYLALPAEDEDAYTMHAAMNAHYAHVTAPLRRLVDRFGLEVCRRICAGEEIDEQLRADLRGLPKLMGTSGRLVGQLEGRGISAVEALVLDGRKGEEFSGVVVDVQERRGEPDRGRIVLREPAVEASISGKELENGTIVKARLEEVDPSRGLLRFVLASS